MQQRPLGRSGLMVSRLGLGTMTWGLDTDPDDAGAQLKAFVDAGGNLVDTADVYADGEAEAVLGTLLDAMVSRDDLLIVAKAGLRARAGRRHDASRGHLLKTLDTTLTRLGVSYVDLWLVHGWDAGTPLEETLTAVDHAVASGKVRYAGVSNFSGWQTARAATWQQCWPGRAPIVASQMEYSLLQRGIEREVLPACEALGHRRAAVVAAGPRGAHRQVPPRPARRLPGRPAALRTLRAALPAAALLGDRRVAGHRRGRARHLGHRGGACLGARPSRRDRPDLGRPHGRAA